MQRNTGYFPTESLEPSGNRLFSRSALNEGDLFRGSLEDALVSGEVVQLIQGRVFLPYARFQVIIDLITIQNSPLIFLPRNLLFSRQARTLKKKSID